MAGARCVQSMAISQSRSMLRAVAKMVPCSTAVAKMATAISLLLPSVTRAQVSEAHAAHAASIRVRAVPIAASDDTTALARVARTVGVSRVVILGESTHGDGGGHQLRAALVKMLHEKMGFNVLVWEAGLFDAARMDSLLGAATPLDSVAPSALYFMWARAEELRPLLSYVRETKSTSRPMTFAGFDLQRSGPLPLMYSSVKGWFDSVDTALFPRPLADSIDQLVATATAATPQKRFPLEMAADTLLARHGAVLLEIVKSRRARFRSVFGDPKLAFIERVLLNMTAYYDMLRIGSDPARPNAVTRFGFAARERQNAENLLWLLDQRFRGQKLIVWTHNAHAAAARFNAAFSAIAASGDTAAFDGMGWWLRRKLGKDVYSLGFLTASGTWGYPGFGVNAVETPAPESLTGLLHESALPGAFLDFRAMTEAWIRQPMSGNIDGQHPGQYPVTWPSTFDGVLFLDVMTPSTLAKPE